MLKSSRSKTFLTARDYLGRDFADYRFNLHSAKNEDYFPHYLGHEDGLTYKDNFALFRIICMWKGKYILKSLIVFTMYYKTPRVGGNCPEMARRLKRNCYSDRFLS